MKRVLIPYRHVKKVKTYVDAAHMGGVEPVAICVSERPKLDDFQGLLLMGGTDVNPKLYHQAAAPEVDAPDDERDEVEWRLIDQAFDMDVPILAICRGLQLLNVHQGGTLMQHLGKPEHDVEAEDKGTVAHSITLDPESHLADIYGELKLEVNSRHHQAVDRLGEGFRISARDALDESVIEGLEKSNRKFVIAVQWHPEDQVVKRQEQRKLFWRFAQAMSGE